MYKRTFVICIQISKPTQADNVRSMLNTHIAENLVEVMDNVFVIIARNSDETCESIRAKFTTFINDCVVFIMETSQHAAWRLPATTSEKIKSVL